MLEFKLESFSIKINIIIVNIDETVSIQRLFYEKAATDVIVLCICIRNDRTARSANSDEFTKY